MSTSENGTTARGKPAAAKKTTRTEPLKKYLPTDRMRQDTQIDNLRAFASVSGPNRAPVSLEDVSKVAKLSPSTLSLGTPFWVQVGFLEKSEAGFRPCSEVMDLKRATELGDARAPFRLSPILRRS